MAENDYRQIFSKNLKHYMNLSHKNQMDLMRDLNLSSSTVSNWCTGTKLPRMNKVQMLADYFGIEKSDLIEEKKDTDGTHCFSPKIKNIAQEIADNEDLTKLFDVVKTASPDDLKLLYEIALRIKQ